MQGPMGAIRLFNEPAGRDYLVSQGVDPNLVDQLDLLGISSVSNVLSSIKFAKYYEMGANDVVVTVATDSMEMYQSRLVELREEEGEFTPLNAAGVYHRYLMGQGIDYVEELGYYDRKRIHNLKYFTWGLSNRAKLMKRFKRNGTMMIIGQAFRARWMKSTS